MCGGYQADRDDLLGRRRALDRNSEEYRRAVRALLDQIEECMHELEQSLALLNKFTRIVNRINLCFAAFAVGLWLFRSLHYLGLL